MTFTAFTHHLVGVGWGGEHPCMGGLFIACLVIAVVAGNTGKGMIGVKCDRMAGPAACGYDNLFILCLGGDILSFLLPATRNYLEGNQNNDDDV